MGSVPTFNASFSVNDIPTDPTTVTFSFGFDPDDAVTVYTYGTDPEITKTGVGEYSVELEVTDIGRWYGRWEATGPAAGASELTFEAWSNFEDGYLWTD